MPRAKNSESTAKGSQEVNIEEASGQVQEGNCSKGSEIIQALRSKEVIKAFEEMLIPSLNKFVKDSIEVAIAPINDKIEQIEATQHECKVKQDQASQNLEKMSKAQIDMQSKIREMERSLKACNVIFHGVSIINDDNQPRDTLLKLSVMKIINDVNIEGILPEHIVSINKITPAGKPAFLMVRMSSPDLKKKLYTQRTKLKNCSDRVYINEDLTKEEATIFKRARQQVKQGTLHSCWSSDGLIYAKTSTDGKPFQLRDI